MIELRAGALLAGGGMDTGAAVAPSAKVPEAAAIVAEGTTEDRGDG